MGSAGSHQGGQPNRHKSVIPTRGGGAPLGGNSDWLAMADDPRAADGPAARQGASDRTGTPAAVGGHDADPYGPSDAAARRSDRTAYLSSFS
jgi:hypothetical protein